jgi:hypothetical protein
MTIGSMNLGLWGSGGKGKPREPAVRITEGGDTRITEANDQRVTE